MSECTCSCSVVDCQRSPDHTEVCPHHKAMRQWCRRCGLVVDLYTHTEHVPLSERLPTSVDKHSLLPHDIELREAERRRGR